MRRYGIPAVLAATLISAGCIQQLSTVRGSGSLVTETRDVSGFNAVSLGGQGVLTITVGEKESLTITADDNLLPYIETKVEHRGLSIGPAREARRTEFRPSAPIRYDLTVVDLTAVAVSGAASVRAEALTAEDFNIAVNGAADVEIGRLEAGTFSVAISGCGDVTVAGEADALAIAISGSGVYRGGDLMSRSATCAISGSGDVTVWAEDDLDIGVSGSGAVAYYGEPSVRQDVSGSGSVRALGPRKVTL